MEKLYHIPKNKAVEGAGGKRQGKKISRTGEG